MEENMVKQPNIEKESLLKKILLSGGETANFMKIGYLLGAGFGVAGRSMGEDWLPIIPPALNFFKGIPMPTSERVACYTAYGAGITTAYADKIYEYVKPLLD